MTDPTVRLSIVALGVRSDLIGSAAAVEELAGPFADLIHEPSRDAEALPHTTIAVPDGPDPLQVLAELTQGIVERSPLLICHAGLVIGAAGSIAIPAPSGTGKSTLTIALVRAGFRYATDEAIGFAPAGQPVHGLRRPVSVAGDVWSLVLADQADPPAAEAEKLIRISAIGSLASPVVARIDQVIIPRRTSLARTPRLVRASAGVTASALLHRSFNHFRNPAASLQTVLSIARGAECWYADYSDATELAALLAERFDQPAAAAAR